VSQWGAPADVQWASVVQATHVWLAVSHAGPAKLPAQSASTTQGTHAPWLGSHAGPPAFPAQSAFVVHSGHAVGFSGWSIATPLVHALTQSVATAAVDVQHVPEGPYAWSVAGSPAGVAVETQSM
jgi:hypothetical protein